VLYGCLVYLWPFGKLCCHAVYVVVISCKFSRFWYAAQRQIWQPRIAEQDTVGKVFVWVHEKSFYRRNNFGEKPISMTAKTTNFFNLFFFSSFSRVSGPRGILLDYVCACG
jgi:hypothetical protein